LNVALLPADFFNRIDPLLPLVFRALVADMQRYRLVTVRGRPARSGQLWTLVRQRNLQQLFWEGLMVEAVTGQSALSARKALNV
jgi:hypothetical protein